MALGFCPRTLVFLVAIFFLLASAKHHKEGKKTDAETTKHHIGTVTTSPTTANNPWDKLRLPKTLVPSHYDVELQVYLKKNAQGLFIFKGKSTVLFKCMNKTNLIIIHSNKLNYTMQDEHHVSLSRSDGSTAPDIQKTWLELKTHYLVVELKKNLKVGKEYSLNSVFIGELADDLSGFYRSVYREGNDTRILATSQMQATYARKVFPCFDEPAMKATFSVTLIYRPHLVAVSNMPDISTTPQVIDGVTWHVKKFEKTPKMSTYLLAFVVCDFDKIEEVSNGVQIHIWARKKAIAEKQGDYTLNVTGPILNFFTKYYNTNYPLPKSDQLAIPDFSSGAMENWGLVIYRESTALFNPSVSSIRNKEKTVITIAHELAHQWFGNLVTMQWWNDVWLNEGFATYVSYLGADYVEPTWNVKDLIISHEIYPVMDVDALASSHPLSTTEEDSDTPEKISSLFDTIAYNKGGAVIRMLSSFMTEKVFAKGLSSYLRANAFGNTVYNDLWEHLQKAVDNQTKLHLPESVKGIMDTWVLQMGYPVVTVNTTTGAISQEHFLLDHEANVTRPSKFNYVWAVPITAIKSGKKQKDTWLQETSDNKDAFKVSKGSSDWLLLNVNMTGFYRVNYDEENWRRLLQQLETVPEKIPVINRAQIINDAFNLARAKRLPTVLALETTRFLYQETEFMPWQAAITSLNYYKLMFDRTHVYGAMMKYMKKQVQPLFKYYKEITNDWTVLPDGPMKQYNEFNAINTACLYGLRDCWTLATNLFRKWMKNPKNNPISPILKPAIYCNAIANGGEEEWDFAWKMLHSSTVATEADFLRVALTCSKEPWILNRFLHYSLDKKKIRKQDAISTIVNIAISPVGYSLAWDFVRSKWGTIFSQFGGSSFTFGNLIRALTQRFSTRFELQQLERFVKEKKHTTGFGSGARAMEQALEKTRANIKWLNDNSEVVRKWFEKESETGV